MEHCTIGELSKCRFRAEGQPHTFSFLFSKLSLENLHISALKWLLPSLISCAKGNLRVFGYINCLRKKKLKSKYFPVLFLADKTLVSAVDVVIYSAAGIYY